MGSTRSRTVGAPDSGGALGAAWALAVDALAAVDALKIVDALGAGGHALRRASLIAAASALGSGAVTSTAPAVRSTANCGSTTITRVPSAMASETLRHCVSDREVVTKAADRR